LAKPVRVPGQSGSKLFDRATAIGAVLAGEAQRQHLALAPLGGRPDHFGDALEHVGVNLPRHERIAELLVLVISLALLLERFPRLSMSFSSVMRLSWSGLIRPSATAMTSSVLTSSRRHYDGRTTWSRPPRALGQSAVCFGLRREVAFEPD
jgi:hypothetical protein